MVKDYYKVLQIEENATESEIRCAYRDLAKKLHPDVNKSPDANSVFVEINEAYGVLSNPDKKKRYDDLLALKKDVLKRSGRQDNGDDTLINPFLLLFPDLHEISSIPPLGSCNGIGIRPYGQYNYDLYTNTFETIFYFCIFWFPIFTIGRYRVAVLERSGCSPVSGRTQYAFIGYKPMTLKDWVVPAITVPLFLILMFNIINSESGKSSYSNSTQYQQEISELQKLDEQLTTLENTLTDLETKMGDLEGQINRIEASARTGLPFDERNYENLVNEYNDYVEEYNSKLELFKTYAKEYDAKYTHLENLKQQTF